MFDTCSKGEKVLPETLFVDVFACGGETVARRGISAGGLRRRHRAGGRFSPWRVIAAVVENMAVKWRRGRRLIVTVEEGGRVFSSQWRRGGRVVPSQ